MHASGALGTIAIVMGTIVIRATVVIKEITPDGAVWLCGGGGRCAHAFL